MVFINAELVRNRSVKYIVLSCLFLCNTILFSQPLATGHTKYLGCCIGSPVPASFDTYWNQVTPENAGKWGSVETGRDYYDWGGLDMVYNYAIQRNIPFRLHVLVWGKQQPWWITSLDSTQQAEEVEEWFRLAGEKCPYADIVEVVNEAISNSYDPYPPYRNAIGGGGETGWDWVIWAFEKARQYFPNSRLFINEWGTISYGKSITTYLQIINLLKERNLIDGICEQGHYFSLGTASANTMRTNLDKLAATGLPICISEFEVDEADDNTQLRKYKEIFPILWEHPGVEGITLWGYRSGMWKANGFLERSDGSERPALQWLREYLASTDVKKSMSPLPASHVLCQNYPNPFNPTTTIYYSLKKPCNVKMAIHNARGEKVKTLTDSFENVGTHSLIWDATDEESNPLASGTYFYRLETEDQILYKKMLLIR